MESKMITLEKVKNFLAPLPVVLVTIRVNEGDQVHDNLAPISWAGINESKPHQVNINIANSKYTARSIEKTGEFGICIPSSKYLNEVDVCGTVHGDKCDKFKMTGLTKFEAKSINVPLIVECPINMECKLKKIVVFESHKMYIGEIVQTHLDENFCDTENNPDFGKIGLLCYVNGTYWSLGKKIKKLYFSKIK